MDTPIPHVAQMLRAHPVAIPAEQQLAAAIAACLDCSHACTVCADACLTEEHPAKLLACVRANLDCADLCSVTARILSRAASGERLVEGALALCATACLLCAEECAAHAHLEHCRICEEACRSCETACNALAASVH